MGRFHESVQRDDVVGPLRREFKLSKWNSAFKELANDEADSDLHRVGLLIHAKAKTIRAELKVTTRAEVSATTKLRAFVAIANHNFLVVAQKAREAFEAAVQTDDRILTSDLRSIKFPLPIGEDFSPDELIQSTVDAVQISLKVILRDAPPLSGSPKFGSADWQGFRFDFNLGQAYFSIEELWDECLWNGYRMNSVDQKLVFRPVDQFWITLRAASRARHDNLILQFFSMAKQHESRIGQLGRLGFQDIEKIKKVGRKQIIKLAPKNCPTKQGAHLASLFAYASEPYYEVILNEARPSLADGTLNELLRGWAVIIRSANTLKSQVEKLKFPESDNPNTWLPAHAPVLQLDVLRRAIAESIGISYQRANALLHFLTYRGEPDQELWAQPLVSVGDSVLAPVFAVTEHPNLRRVVDVWLRQLDIDMGLRGPAFEQHLRERIQRDINRSPLLGDARVLNTGLKFRPPENREEEIDLVVVIGDLVILGEAKCSVSPTEAKQYARHRNLVIGATAQIQRKAESVSNHRVSFQARLNDFGISLPSNFIILPVVVLNDAIHSGMPVNGIPVIDEHIFSVFFAGEIVDVAERGSNGDFASLRKRTLYASASDAVGKAAHFFSAPPQLDVFLHGLIERSARMPAIREADWEADYLVYDCIPVVENLNPLH